MLVRTNPSVMFIKRNGNGENLKTLTTCPPTDLSSPPPLLLLSSFSADKSSFYQTRILGKGSPTHDLKQLCVSPAPDCQETCDARQSTLPDGQQVLQQLVPVGPRCTTSGDGWRFFFFQLQIFWEPYVVTGRAIYGSRAIGSRPLV